VGAAGNGFSTPRELTRFFEALANGAILKPETFATMVRPRAINDSYGLGIVLRDRDGSPEYGHNGALEPHGFNAHISTFPSWDTTVAVFVARGVTVLDATSIAQRLIDAIMGKAYRSPFPEGVSDWLMANAVAGVFIVMPAWVLIGLAAMAIRPIRKPRLAWALRATNNAGALILIRGILGMHGDGFDRLVWPAVVAVPVCAMVWWRMQHDAAQPVVADHPSTARRIVGWMGLLFAVLIMPVIGWLVGVYAVHFVLMTALAIGCALRRGPAASQDSPHPESGV
ncbi:MAG: serine hydrolase, partial [Pseudomonadota bacterium]|nr:serine hydrolase [Pseudomonadota bacterium]